MKLKGFSFIELIVVMAISAFVISISYTSYMLINFQFINYKKTNQAIKELYQFAEAMQTDIENGFKVNSIGNDLNIEMNNGIICNYKFKDDYIIREFNNHADTFFINVLKTEKKSGSNPLNYGLIDELIIETSVLDNNQKFVFYKKYEADVLIEQEKDEGSN